jgi:hypothetical protein
MREPYHDESSRIGDTPGFDLAFCVQGELLAHKEYFRRQFWVRAQTEPKVAYCIDNQREQHGCRLDEVAQAA